MIKLNNNTYIKAKFAINLLYGYKQKFSQKVRKVIMEYIRRRQFLKAAQVCIVHYKTL